MSIYVKHFCSLNVFAAASIDSLESPWMLLFAIQLFGLGVVGSWLTQPKEAR